MAWKILIVFFTSAVKFLFAPVTSMTMGLSWLQTILITSVGGCTGVMVFFFASSSILRRALKKQQLKEKNPNYIRKKRFTRVNKTIVRIKRSMGLPGIAFVTLPFISVPLCTIIAAKFFRHKKETLPFLLISVLVWSLLLTSITFFVA